MDQWIDSLMDGYCISAETKSYTTSTGNAIQMTTKIIKTAVRFPTSEISIINGCNDKSIYLITKELKPLSHCEIAFHIKKGNTCQIFSGF